MGGAGALYPAHRGGRVTRDDEGAPLPGAEAMDWRPLTEPLVEVRATLAAAAKARMLSIADARRLRDAGISIHYSRRDWRAIRRDARLSPASDVRFSHWLESNVVRLKRSDA